MPDAGGEGRTYGRFMTVIGDQTGDEALFAELFGRYRRELLAHCRRMLGSREDAEEQLQETFLRAWRSRSSFRGDASFRSWLHRIANNVCLDALSRRRRAPLPLAGLEPDEEPREAIAPRSDEPDVSVAGHETLELALTAAVQELPPRQQTALLVHGMLGWSADETAGLLDASTASVSSAIQRARRTLRGRLPEQRLDWALADEPSERERALVRRYLCAIERSDADELVAVMRELEAESNKRRKD